MSNMFLHFRLFCDFPGKTASEKWKTSFISCLYAL
jgi:hypothetical protein